MADKKVLIIIPVYNGVAEFLGDCLSSLRNISYPKENFLVLAIDDVSADNSAEFIRNKLRSLETKKTWVLPAPIMSACNGRLTTALIMLLCLIRTRRFCRNF